MRDREEVVFCQGCDPARPAWRRFADRVAVVEAWQPAEVLAKLAVVEQAVDGGLYAAGFVTYEAASGIDEVFRTRAGGDLPLLWFGLFRRMAEEDAAGEECLDRFAVGPWRPSVSREQYDATIDRIRDYIARGHTYQVNYTFRLRAEFEGDPWSFFRRLCEAQRSRYGAYVDIGRHVLCSVSPELFFQLEGDRLLTRPMKGTCLAG